MLQSSFMEGVVRQAGILRVTPPLSHGHFLCLFCGGGHNGDSFLTFHSAALCVKTQLSVIIWMTKPKDAIIAVHRPWQK